MTDALYSRIMKMLIEKIESGEYPLGSKLPTESELSEECYVSRITSRRALNELAQIGYVVRKRRTGTFVTRTTASNINYTINGERMAEGKAPGVIGLIFPFNAASYDGQEFLNGVLDVTNKHRYYTIVQNSLSNYQTERAIIERYTTDRLNGIIYYPINSNSNFIPLAHLASIGYPIVTIDKTMDGLNLPSVVSDNTRGFYGITKHIIQAGHRNIGIFSDTAIDSASSLRDRFEGFLSALAEYSIPFNPRHVFTPKQIVYDKPDFVPPDYMQKRNKLYMKNIDSFMSDGVTAIQCMSDGTVHQLLSACEYLKVKIPRDLSVSGFDGWPETTTLKFTTVKQDLYEMGRQAAELIIEKIDNPGTPARQVVTPSQMLYKNSIKDIS